MKTYCFECSTDNGDFVLSVDATRLDSALGALLILAPSALDFAHRLEVFRYTVLCDGKLQHRHLDCLHTYLLVDGKLVRWFEDGIYERS